MQERFAIRIFKEYLNFGCAHFLIFGDGTREQLHGHNYRVSVALEGDVVAGDLVVDFIPVKPLIKRFCDELDHHVILPRDNPHLKVVVGPESVEAVHRDGGRFVFPLEDVRILPLPNTSSEMLARHLARRIAKALAEEHPDAKIRSVEVQVEESPGQAGVCRVQSDSDA